MLEYESGRIQLVGESVRQAQLVTGVIAGALGIETNSGEFEVVDLCYAGVASDQEASIEAMGTDHKSQNSKFLH